MAPILISEYLSPELIEKFHSRTRPGKWGCLEWHGARNRGYGVLEHDGRTFFAHRVAWVIHHQVDIPGWLVVDHLCCNKGCVNHDHLEAVTDVENVRRVKHAPRGWVSVRSAKYPGRRKLREAKVS